MKYNFSDRVRVVLGQARDEANSLGHEYVGTEHILLALLQEREGAVARLFGGLRGGRAAVRARLGQLVRKGRAVGSRGELPYTSRAKKVLEYAIAEARELNHSHVDTTHLLLGLLREDKGIAAVVLGELGLTLAGARSFLARAAGAGGVGGEVVPGADLDPADRVWFVEIDASDASPIYEQIMARIEEAVATGWLAPGERLPSVRDLAAELGVAPGTVARAYSALEQRGVLVTEGARGTHVADEAPVAKQEELGTALEELLRPVVIAAYHMGATSQHVRDALERVMRGILSDADGEERGDSSEA